MGIAVMRQQDHMAVLDVHIDVVITTHRVTNWASRNLQGHIPEGIEAPIIAMWLVEPSFQPAVRCAFFMLQFVEKFFDMLIYWLIIPITILRLAGMVSLSGFNQGVVGSGLDKIAQTHHVEFLDAIGTVIIFV
jgi:hypothetical protein